MQQHQTRECRSELEKFSEAWSPKLSFSGGKICIESASYRGWFFCPGHEAWALLSGTETKEAETVEQVPWGDIFSRVRNCVLPVTRWLHMEYIHVLLLQMGGVFHEAPHRLLTSKVPGDVTHEEVAADRADKLPSFGDFFHSDVNQRLYSANSHLGFCLATSEGNARGGRSGRSSFFLADQHRPWEADGCFLGLLWSWGTAMGPHSTNQMHGCLSSHYTETGPATVREGHQNGS